ncbi:MAG: hypothetical protein OQK73_01295 [Gammaproteobacteria bacterium]|nr:hypothetical protein [Gammaproteobacteria bacterium]
MAQLPDTKHQISQAHAMLIHHVVQACQNADAKKQLLPMLEALKQNGWETLITVIHHILNGRRDESLINGLDEEDTVITQAILMGLQDPSTMPDPDQKADPSNAAPGIALMIHNANRGSTEALQAVSLMAEQMTNTHGDMRILGGNMKRLMDGERDADILCQGMSESGQELTVKILEELSTLDNQ